MKELIKKIILVLILAFTGLSFGQLALADSNDFSVIPVLPENQNPDVPSYFDLIVTPKQQQTLQVKIKNNSNENVKYKLYVNTATTNQNGIIDYSISDFEKDESMKLSLKDCITLNESVVEVPANSEKEVSLELNIPEAPFEGIALGGITVEPIAEEDNEAVNNLFTRTLAIQIAESTTAIVPELYGGEVLVSQENLRNNIKFELRNSTPTIISKVKAEIAITKQGDKQPILEQTKEHLSFAPNSKFSLMTEWNGQFESGKYVYNIDLKDDEGNKWTFSKEFEIKTEEAEKLNETSVDEKKSSVKDYLLYIVVLFIVLMGALIWVIRKKMKHK
ncbi:TPA: DUF916 and DUF3324 domain-containing protein [Enterococcus faecalis]|uniref:DUF916 and DUF3324 domain-containing protein n=1 Tax=Enterococcus faecalis TaxID=1351 RepID=UPI00045AD1CF|nr:DUF916 and DUF3324 domain-containing protein [Enterococcus faecalis]EGO7756654.1 DUF916 and DUF3324 domain-containing protein [Enterococcus faecalis]EHG5974445.1 DUF916 and DUF3324 domain-containing protein [Enterococcus faecalis]KAJ84743.1 cell surface protein precursor [Enterococcus faecalis NY9]HAP2807595.1 DUF916 and DUF3324 domain-containing protein [Enterococcus faecalis]HBI1635437.1 DUF916 and DUF3324 domain-containing protein [Enterococcus faecalis]